MAPQQRFSTGSNAAPTLRGRLEISGDIFGPHNWGMVLLLAPSDGRPRVLLLTSLGAQDEPSHKRMIQLQMSTVLRLRSSTLE